MNYKRIKKGQNLFFLDLSLQVIPVGGLSNHFLDDLVALANLYDKLILKQNNDLAFFEHIHNPKFRKEAAKKPQSIRL